MSRNTRSRVAPGGAKSASAPSANAVSVDIAAPQPWAPAPPALKARKIATGSAMPPIAASTGIGEPVALAQVADVQLALGLQPHDQEEEGHQALVDPVAQVSEISALPTLIDSLVRHTDS